MSGQLKISATPVAGFWRAGRHWPHEGTVISVDELGDGVLERLKAEPMLRVTPVDAAHPAQALSDEQLFDAVKAAIATLEADDFDKDGTPKVAPLKKRLPDEKDRITAELRDTVWASIEKPES